MDNADPVELVTDRSRVQSLRNTVGRVTIPLPPLPGQPGDLALAAFALVLYRYTSQTGLLLDSDLTERGSGPLRIVVEPAEPAAELLHRIQAARPNGGPSRLPVRFADHPVPLPMVPECDLALSIDRSTLYLDFHEGLFDLDSARRMGCHLRLALDAIAGSPQRLVRELSLLADGERKRIVERFNATARPYPADTPIHRLFEEHAGRTPDALAVTWLDQRLTYRDLDLRANRLAHELRAAGVTTGQLVGLMVARTPELVIAKLAILKAGGAYLPIEPDYPSERVEYLLRDAGVRVLVAGSQPTARSACDRAVLSASGDGRSATGPQVRVCGDDLAYVMYTSGTTGRPKGVQVSHRSVVRLVRGTDYVDLSADTRVLATCATVFDVATFELWGPLLAGGSVHLVPDDVILSATALGRAVVEQRITTMWLTSPLFNHLVEQDATIFRPLCELLVGGDVLSPRHVGKVLD
ncbi:MAG: AMP-binding protein, partial [Pseudonocardiaceae bacterium]